MSLSYAHGTASVPLLGETIGAALDRVGIWSANVAEWVITEYAAAKAGAILVNITRRIDRASSSTR